MDKLLYTLILDDIEKSNFQSAINQLQKIHTQDDKDYLYLRSYLEYFQKNFYASLDLILVCQAKFPIEFRKEEKFIELLIKVLNSLEKFDLVNNLRNSNEREKVLNKLSKWQNYRYE